MKPIRKEYYPIIEQYINEYRKTYGSAPMAKEVAAHLAISVPTAWRYPRVLGTVQATCYYKNSLDRDRFFPA